MQSILPDKPGIKVAAYESEKTPDSENMKTLKSLLQSILPDKPGTKVAAPGLHLRATLKQAFPTLPAALSAFGTIAWWPLIQLLWRPHIADAVSVAVASGLLGMLPYFLLP